MFLNFLLVLTIVDSASSIITDKDLEKYLGIDLNKTGIVSWKDWVNNNPQGNPNRFPAPPCIDYKAMPSNTILHNKTLRQCCNNETDFCDESRNLTCLLGRSWRGLGVCRCTMDYYLNATSNTCEFRQKKELGERCSIKDNCYAAFADCIRGKCACKDGFVWSGSICEPKEYDCPYKTPITVDGSIVTCRINSTHGNECPEGSWCLKPIDGFLAAEERVKFFTSVKLPQTEKGAPPRVEQVELSYCCPSVPQFSIGTISPDGDRPRVFQDVCLYGKPLNTRPCPYTHYMSPGIGAGMNCCPLPCLARSSGLPVVRDGKCADS